MGSGQIRKGKMSQIPWNDLELVLMLQREGSMRAAAKELGTSHPTLSRRLRELQESIGVSLVERDGKRLRLTAAGEDLARTAARVEAEVDAVSLRIAGRDHRLEGVVRVALSPSMLAALAPFIPEFHALYPGIQLELSSSLTLASLTRREAEVAIRFTNSPHETLIGRRTSTFEQAVFIRQDLLEHYQQAGIEDPRDWSWVDWDDAHKHHESSSWVRANIEPARVVVRGDSSLALYNLIRSGVACGYAPTMLAVPDPTLVRAPAGALGALPTFNRGIWVLTHEELKTNRRVRATADWIAELLRVADKGAWCGTRSLIV